METTQHNIEVEREEIKHLQTGPDRVFAYVHMPRKAGITSSQSFSWASGDSLKGCCKTALAMHAIMCPVCHLTSSQMQVQADRRIDIQTWLGTPIATHVWIGPRRYMGFNRAYRRPVSCRINGVLYHGWYFESSGDYCRLKKARKQK